MKWHLFWSLILIFLASAVQTSAHRFPCDVDFESEEVTTEQPAVTLSPKHSFALLIVNLYGSKRILDGPICLMDGTCVNIVDSALQDERGITFIRDISTTEVQITTMNLKFPQRLDGSNVDTSKWEIDHESLDFISYTVTMIEEMFASGAVEISPNAEAEVLSIGLGAGYIDSYLHKNYPRMNITVVEIDQNMLDIALKWFGLQLDNRHRVVIENGVEFVKRAVRGGVVILNVLTLTGDDMAAAKKVKKAFEKAFKKCMGKYAPFSPPNIVMTCAQSQRPPGLKERYQQWRGYST